MPNQSKFPEYIENAKEHILNLPHGEIKYYLYILVNSIKGQDNKKNLDFIVRLSELIYTLQELHVATNSTNDALALVESVAHHYDALEKIAQTSNFSYQLKTHLINLGAVILGTVCGILGAIIGGVAGLARGLWNYAPWSGFTSGVFLGLVSAAEGAYRLPKKLLKDEMTRQLKNGLDGLKECLDRTTKEKLGQPLDEEIKPMKFYRQQVIAEIIELYDADSHAFSKFLTSDINYNINTYVATFTGDPLLQGYVGHHAYIKIDIKDKHYLIEFNTEPSDTTTPISQQDTRTVIGDVLINMLAYHRKLQESSAPTFKYIATHMKPGEVDCYSYVNKILIGTNQESTWVERCKDMTAIGDVLGKFYAYVNPFPLGFFHTKKQPAGDDVPTQQATPPV